MNMDLLVRIGAYGARPLGRPGPPTDAVEGVADDGG
jgi:hypothetical protein